MNLCNPVQQHHEPGLRQMDVERSESHTAGSGQVGTKITVKHSTVLLIITVNWIKIAMMECVRSILMILFSSRFITHTRTHIPTTLQSKIDKGVKVEFVLDLLFFLNLSIPPKTSETQHFPHHILLKFKSNS